LKVGTNAPTIQHHKKINVLKFTCMQEFEIEYALAANGKNKSRNCIYSTPVVHNQ